MEHEHATSVGIGLSLAIREENPVNFLICLLARISGSNTPILCKFGTPRVDLDIIGSKPAHLSDFFQLGNRALSLFCPQFINNPLVETLLWTISQCAGNRVDVGFAKQFPLDLLAELITPEEAVVMTSERLQELLFLPGLTTA